MQESPPVFPQVTKLGIPQDCQRVLDQESTTARRVAIRMVTSQVLQQVS